MPPVGEANHPYFQSNMFSLKKLDNIFKVEEKIIAYIIWKMAKTKRIYTLSQFFSNADGIFPWDGYKDSPAMKC